MLSSHGNPIAVELVTQNLAVKIISDLSSGAGATSITLSASYVDDRAQLHCDKWIEETAFHINRYSAAKKESDKPPLSSLPAPGTLAAVVGRLILPYKAFSGDVSGVIGEAIFSSLLVQEFDLQDQHFAHFRADKQSGIFPDFGIFFLSTKLRTRLEWDSVPVINPVVPAEVKTVTSGNTSDIKPKLKKAIEQVQNFWVRVKPGGGAGRSGIICLAFRNQQLTAYDVALIWGK